MVKGVRLLRSKIGFGSETRQINDFTIGIHKFSARRLTLKEHRGEQAVTFTCCAVGKGLSLIPLSKQMAGNA